MAGSPSAPHTLLVPILSAAAHGPPVRKKDEFPELSRRDRAMPTPQGDSMGTACLLRALTPRHFFCGIARWARGPGNRYSESWRACPRRRRRQWRHPPADALASERGLAHGPAITTAAPCCGVHSTPAHKEHIRPSPKTERRSHHDGPCCSTAKLVRWHRAPRVRETCRWPADRWKFPRQGARVFLTGFVLAALVLGAVPGWGLPRPDPGNGSGGGSDPGSPGSGGSTPSEYYSTTETSEEKPPIVCNGGDLMSGVHCQDSFCDLIKLTCRRTSAAPTYYQSDSAQAWQAYIPNDHGNQSVCPNSEFLTGIACQGGWCAQVSAYCTTLTGKTRNEALCLWSGWVSEENGGQLTFPEGYYAAGVGCDRAWCDNLQFYMCPVSKLRASACRWGRTVLRPHTRSTRAGNRLAG
jgi:hypothetical protein